MRFGRDADDAYRCVRAQMSWMRNRMHGHARYRALSALCSTIAAHDTGTSRPPGLSGPCGGLRLPGDVSPSRVAGDSRKLQVIQGSCG